MIAKAGGNSDIIWNNQTNWSELGNILNQWIDELSDDIAYAIISAISVIDFPAIILDGDIPSNVRSSIIQAIQQKLELIDQQGLSSVTIIEGSLGKDARVIGGASLPLLANFTRNRDVAFGG